MSSVFERHPDILRLEEDQGMPRFLLDALEHLVAVRWVGGQPYPGEADGFDRSDAAAVDPAPELSPPQRWLAFLGMRLGVQVLLAQARDLGHDEAVSAILDADNVPDEAQQANPDFRIEGPLPEPLWELARRVRFGPRLPPALDRTVAHGMHLGLWVLDLFGCDDALGALRAPSADEPAPYRYRIDLGPDQEVVLSRIEVDDERPASDL